MSKIPISPEVMERYKKFLNQHVNGKMAENQCDNVIRRRKISQRGTNDCKPVNTFILANKGQINPVCAKAGRPYGKNLTISNLRFPIVTCKSKSQKKLPHCKYRGKKDTRWIVIGCVKGWPVHYEEGILL
uniref:Ribonuclease A-domain domain-containing protein n=1 Tax=Denticeps clupeoides TaxID=299321 RepID=A0AAY4A4J0_9TELE